MNAYSERIHALSISAGLLGFTEAARYLYAGHEAVHPDNIKFYLFNAERLLKDETFATQILAEIRDITRHATFDANKYWLTAGRETVGA